MSRRLLWIAVWIVSILATAQYVKAQRFPDVTTLPAPALRPFTVPASDIEFRVTGYGPQGVQGRLMVKVQGKWHSVELVPAPLGEN